MITSLLSPTLLASLSAVVAPLCDETASTQRVVAVASSASDDQNRTIEIRVENGQIVAKVDGKVLDPARVRREGDRLVLLGEDGAPLAGVPSVWMAERGPAKVKVGDRELRAEEIVIDGSHGQITLGPQIRAEMDRAMQQVEVAISRASEAGDLFKRYVAESALADLLRERSGDPAMLARAMASAAGATEPKVMLGVTLQEPDPALRAHLGLEEGTATLLTNIVPELPAHKAGLRTFDLVVQVDGQRPANPAVIRELIATRSPGDSIAFTVRRPGDRTDDVNVVLEAFDPQRLGASVTQGFRVGDEFDVSSSLLAPLRRQLRMAPLDAERGDFLFELALPAPDAQGTLRWSQSSNAAQAPSQGAPRLPAEGQPQGADRGPAVLPPPPPPPPPAAGGPGAAAARLERLEARLEEMSSRLERLMDRLESTTR